MPEYSVGSLVRARSREWVVLPESDDDFLLLQPVTGLDDDVAGLAPSLEGVAPAEFPLPDLAACGNVEDWKVMRDAVRFGIRSSIGPFQSLARVAVSPRAYQLVPLMMALKLDTVRLLIADDVGIGKTVESLLVAKELLDRGDVRRMAVLCSPALAEQWQREMREKFHLEAELVLPSTARGLERRCRFGQSLFDRFPFVVVSTDFIKSDVRLQEFLAQAPELVIVDEAHGCAGTGTGRSATQRFELVKGLAADPDRHLLLVTATPHSGKVESFRNLLSFLSPEFDDLPEDLGGDANLSVRRTLARHFVQRRRADIESYVGESTPFPHRLVAEETYGLSDEYRRLVERVIGFARESVTDSDGRRQARVRWWSLLTLLRALASSPAAAAATLRNRPSLLGAESAEEVDEAGRMSVFDLMDDESLDGVDAVPGSDISELDDDRERTRRRLRDIARQVEALANPDLDTKLKGLIEMVRGLTREGYSPVIFCRFIPTADYVATHLRGALGRSATVESVTGLLSPAEREDRVQELGRADAPRVLVATDCLSEGVNLQDHFNAVIHYDLAWNPTRHEQREGRVDRYGQPNPTVRAITYYGRDNRIDRVVLDVLIRRHEAIRKATGVSVPVPGDADRVVGGIFQEVIRRGEQADQLRFEEFDTAEREMLELEWEDAADQERRSRHMFAQHAIQPLEVQKELDAVRAALGDSGDVLEFLELAIPRLGGRASRDGDRISVELDDANDLVQFAPWRRREFRATVELPAKDGELYFTRTHPFVQAVAARVLDRSLKPSDSDAERIARCGTAGSMTP